MSQSHRLGLKNYTAMEKGLSAIEIMLGSESPQLN